MIDLVYAKKCVVPTGAANVLQSLHMAEAFGLAGAKVHFLPGVRGRSSAERQQVFAAVLDSLGISKKEAASWKNVAANHTGIYGLRFRMALMALLLRLPKAFWYARDVGEALFLSRAAVVTRRRIRFVFEMHEALHLQPHNADRANMFFRQEKRILQASAGLVVISPALADLARDAFEYTKPILVAPSAYSPSIFKPLPLFGPENPWPGGEGPVQLIYLGQFHEGKGVHNLIQAMQHLPERFRLRVIGGKPAARYKKLRALAAAIPQNESRITFTGFLDQKEVGEACAGAHIFVIPQENDTLFFSPLKLYEAMALGLPVLVTPISTFAAQRKEELVATAPGTGPEDLARGIMALAGDGSLAKTLRENALAASQTATWQARAERILEFCASL